MLYCPVQLVRTYVYGTRATVAQMYQLLQFRSVCPLGIRPLTPKDLALKILCVPWELGGKTNNSL